MGLTLEEANRIVRGAVAKAQELNIKISAAVCDSGGRLEGGRDRITKPTALPQVRLTWLRPHHEEVQGDGRVHGPGLQELHAPLDLFDLARHLRELALDGDAVLNALRSPHQVQEHRLLCLLVTQPGLQVDKFLLRPGC